jgi:hypothetical protein
MGLSGSRWAEAPSPVGRSQPATLDVPPVSVAMAILPDYASRPDVHEFPFGKVHDPGSDDRS